MVHHPAQKVARSGTGGGARRSSLPVFTLNKELHGIVNPVNNADIRAFSRMPSIRDSSVTDDEACVFEGEGEGEGESLDVGYEAGSSESEEEVAEDEPELDSASVPGEGQSASRGQLPGFWLILRLKSSEAGIFFHVRESESAGGKPGCCSSCRASSSQHDVALLRRRIIRI